MEKFISIRPTWTIPLRQIKDNQHISTPRFPFNESRGIYCWLTFSPNGPVVRSGGEKRWSMTFNINHPNMEMEGYFYEEGTKEIYYDFDKTIYENNSLSSMTYSHFPITKRMLRGDSYRYKSGNITFTFRLKLKTSDDIALEHGIPVKPEAIDTDDVGQQAQVSKSADTIETDAFQFGRLLQTEKGCETADAVIFARSERVMPVSLISS